MCEQRVCKTEVARKKDFAFSKGAPNEVNESQGVSIKDLDRHWKAHPAGLVVPVQPLLLQVTFQIKPIFSLKSLPSSIHPSHGRIPLCSPSIQSHSTEIIFTSAGAFAFVHGVKKCCLSEIAHSIAVQSCSCRPVVRTGVGGDREARKMRRPSSSCQVPEQAFVLLSSWLSRVTRRIVSIDETIWILDSMHRH